MFNKENLSDKALEGLAELDEGFMSPKITTLCDWYKLDGDSGIQFVPCFDVIDKRFDMTKPETFSDLYSGLNVYEVTRITGCGCRLSADGYMDKTDWVVFPTAEEAAQYLIETYL